MQHTDLMHVLRECRNAPVYVKGNFARAHAIDIAMGASLGFITTMVEWGEFTNRWHLTTKGLECLTAESKARNNPKKRERK
jgi:hypothetical protein